jgi:peptidoglycan/LPS O-acetylase OafA/YrhL
MVVIGHGISFMGLFMFLHEPNFPWIQNIAVVLFFLLSGVLITHTTLTRKKNKGYTFKNFFVDRFARIYSVYIPLLFFILVIDGITIYLLSGKDTYDSYNLRTFILNIFMLQNFPMLNYLSAHFSPLSFLSYLVCTTFGSARINWTLSMEWWIYLFVGWFLLGAQTIKNKVGYVLLLVVLSLPPLCFCLLGYKVGIVWFGGALVTILLNAKINLGSPTVKLVLSVVFFIVSFTRIILIHYAYDPVFYVLISLSIYFLLEYSNSTKRRILPKLKPVIDRFAAYSFTLFLMHYSIFNLLTLFKDDFAPELLFVTGFIVSNFAAFTLAYLVEMRYKDFRKFLYKKFNLKYYS